MKTCFYLLVSVLLLQACSPAYVPNLRNAPAFTKKGEFQGTVQTLNGIDVQAAVSVSEHIGIMSNFSYGSRGSMEDENYHTHKLFEGGLGYFKNADSWGFQIYGGYGKGSAEGLGGYLDDEDLVTTTKFDRYFIQPAFTFYRGRVTMAAVSRITYLDFSSFRMATTAMNFQKQPVFTFEPAFIANMYFADNKAFLTMQMGLAGVFRSEQDVSLQHRFFTTGIGMGIRLGGTADLRPLK